MSEDDERTIAAIATAQGRGGVAIVRVSGPEAFAIAARIAGTVPAPGRASLRRLRDGEGGRAIDDAVVLAFRAPRSYTGEDVVEFQCHGGAVTPRRVLEACFAAGARLARRGEFTERALLNGKLDIEQAESVLDLVDAKTERAADMALAGLAGERRRVVRELYDAALELSADLEHALDVDEGDLPAGFAAETSRRMAELRERIVGEMCRLKARRIMRDGAVVVLAGPPNAGKSSLMNAMLGENRVLVSDTPGTTRDTVEAWLDIGGWPVRLVDTAGLRETGDEVESAGVRRAEEQIACADVVVALAPVDMPVAGGTPVVNVHPKCDLGRVDAEGEGDGRLNVSAKTGEGLGELARAIVVALEAKCHLAADAEGGAAEADVSAFEAARRALSEADGRDPVLAANAVRTAAERIGERIGAAYSADMLENLFSRFCVGK
ncbi:MAG: tRNA uridine-5-carboxymethylaminomethyl(34) synthesis GTPase MnmE [Kiritimatiellae bacterium]|nr:tRNA uridine-5-carboxymethylaminomethyl(34) synthesis GTPase MnmE [Kiritimatiellia bacterium]